MVLLRKSDLKKIAGFWIFLVTRTALDTFFAWIFLLFSVFRSDFPCENRIFPCIFMGLASVFKARPDPKQSLNEEFGRLLLYLIGRLRPGVIFYYRSVFDFQMIALRRGNAGVVSELGQLPGLVGAWLFVVLVDAKGSRCSARKN